MSKKIINLKGQKFGRLIVLSFSYMQNHRSYWLCKCDCGNVKNIYSGDFKNGHTKSCGCLKKNNNFKDITGQKFGRLTVIKFAYVKDENAYFLCQCDCGRKHITKGARLRNGGVKTCGKCINPSGYRIHNMHKHKFYKIWADVKQRCLNKNYKAYKWYGNRGITVCKRWLEFINFRDDMYSSYKEHKLNNSYTSIDRINNNGNYCKENCRWATNEEQQRNKRDNHYLTYKGKTLLLIQWSEKLHINKNTIYGRFAKGCTVKEILSQKRL